MWSCLFQQRLALIHPSFRALTYSIAVEISTTFYFGNLFANDLQCGENVKEIAALIGALLCSAADAQNSQPTARKLEPDYIETKLWIKDFSCEEQKQGFSKRLQKSSTSQSRQSGLPRFSGV